jgi:hypothetical protein
MKLWDSFPKEVVNESVHTTQTSWNFKFLVYLKATCCPAWCSPEFLFYVHMYDKYDNQMSIMKLDTHLIT